MSSTAAAAAAAAAHHYQPPPAPPLPLLQRSATTTATTSNIPYAHQSLANHPDAAVRVFTAWRPLLERMNAGCSAPPAYEHLEQATAAVDLVAREMAKDVELRIAVGQAPFVFPALRNALIFSRNHLFCVFGVGRQGVACPYRAGRAVDLAAAHFMFVRNITAQARGNQTAAWEQGLYEPAEEILSYLCSWLSSTKDCCTAMKGQVKKCVSMGTQMLANMMTANPDVQDKLWPRYFKDSELLSQLLSTCDIQRATYVLICIYNCTLKCRERCLFITETPIGRNLLKLMIRSAGQMLRDPDCSAFEYVYAIFSNMIELDLTANIMQALCLGRDENRPHLLLPCHITFLQLLDGMMDSSRGAPEVSIETALFMVCVLKKCIVHVRRIGGLHDSRPTPQQPPAPDNVGAETATKKSFEDLNFAQDVEGLVLLVQFLVKTTQELGPDAKSKLMHAGLGDALLNLLHFLDVASPRSTLKSLPSPAQPPRSSDITSDTPPSSQEQPSPPCFTSSSTPLPSLASSSASFSSPSALASPPSSPPPPPPSAPPSSETPPPQKQSPFFMLKSDVIRIVANLAYEAPEVQNAFRHIGGLRAVLNHCAIDDDNPYIKEQSILALRNLLDSNPANQRLVEQLRPTGAGIEKESNELLAQMGKVASVNADGKVVVSSTTQKRQPSQQQSRISEIVEVESDAAKRLRREKEARDDIEALGLGGLESRVQFMEVDM
ncbi:hypothetical protein HDU88_000920 [Geranomyces variabilis]|nr:hypothetical protein HDU88_000920 [Geranomyces variabilis]